MRHHSVGTANLTAWLALGRSLRDGANLADRRRLPSGILAHEAASHQDEAEIIAYHLYSTNMVALRSRSDKRRAG